MKWKLIKHVLDKEERDLIYAYCKEKSKEPYEPDKSTPNTPSYYNDAMMKVLHKRFLPLMEKEYGVKLYPTYNYWRMYKTGDMLHKHTDRPACEFSANIHIDHKGEDWPIYIEEDDKENTIVLERGDMLLYKGGELSHRRDELQGGQHAQVFLHYVDQHGVCSQWKWDKLAYF